LALSKAKATLLQGYYETLVVNLVKPGATYKASLVCTRFEKYYGSTSSWFWDDVLESPEPDDINASMLDKF